MNEKISKNIKLGLFVTSGVIVLMGTVFLIGQRQLLFGKSFKVACIFVDANGLRVGNNVRFSGVNVGTVEGVQISGNASVRVDLSLNEEIHRFIKKDTEASIGSESIMGNKVVNLSGGNEDEAEIGAGDQIRTSPPLNFDDVLKKANHSAESAALIMDNLSSITNSLRKGNGAVGKLFMDEELARDLSDSVKMIKKLATEAEHSWLFWGFGKKEPAPVQK